MMAAGTKYQLLELPPPFNMDGPLEDDRFRGALLFQVLPDYLKQTRWFGGKARQIDRVQIVEHMGMPVAQETVTLLLLDVWYSDGKVERYFLPLVFCETIDSEWPEQALVAQMDEGGPYLIDALYRHPFRVRLYEAIRNKSSIDLGDQMLSAYPSTSLKSPLAPVEQTRVLNADQSNTSLIINERYFLKLYRKIDFEINPDLEITRFLSEQTDFRNLPVFLGGIEWQMEGSPPIVLGMMQEMITHQGDCWKNTLTLLDGTFEALAHRGWANESPPPLDTKNWTNLPESISEVIGPGFLELIQLLGQRTGEMHAALASGTSPAFQPQPIDHDYCQNLFTHLEALVNKRTKLVQANLDKVPADLRPDLEDFLAQRETILNQFRPIKDLKTGSLRIRIHGDFHLGQVLFMGDDFIILDFEGEPESTITARKIKHSALKDVAGMLRSFHYALYSTLLFNERHKGLTDEVHPDWPETIYHTICGVYLHGYTDVLKGSPVLPQDSQVFRKLLNIHLLEKAVYELGYELNGRPDWVVIPLKGIQSILSDLGQLSANPT